MGFPVGGSYPLILQGQGHREWGGRKVEKQSQSSPSHFFLKGEKMTILKELKDRLVSLIASKKYHLETSKIL